MHSNIILKILQTVHIPYPLYSVLSFLGFVVVLIPFSRHLQAWNTGTCAYMFLVSLACLIEFVNSLVWAGNLFNTIPVWCDISNRFSTIHYRSHFDFDFSSDKVFARSWRWRCGCIRCRNSALLQSRLSPLPILMLVVDSFIVSTSVNKLFRNVVWLSMIFAFLLASQSL